MSKSGKKKGYEVYFLIPALILFFLFIIASLGDFEYFWGFNFLKFFPLYVRWLFLFAVAVMFLPIISLPLTKISLSLSKKISAQKTYRIFFQVIVSLIFLFLFYYFSSETTLLGDGTLRQNQIGKGEIWLPAELLDFLVHALLYQYVFSPLALSAVACYRAVSIVSGLFFIDGLRRLAFYLDGEKGLFYFLIFISSGTTVLFFGYVESYAIAAAIMPYALLTALKVIDRKKGIVGFLVLFVLLALVHVVPAFILSLGAVLLMFLFNRENNTINKRSSVYPAVMISLAIVTGYILSFSGVEIFKKSLLPLVPAVNDGQGLLTLNHFLNIFNWLYLAASALLFLIYPLLKIKSTLEDTGRLKIFIFGWIGLSALVFMFFYTPQLGGPRDWDIFSLPAFFALSAVVVIYAERCKKTVSVFIWPVIVMAFVTTFSFAIINSSPVKSADRFREIAEITRFKPIFSNLAHLLNYYNKQPELKDRRFDLAREVLKAAPNNVDSSYILGKISQMYYDERQYDQALNYAFYSLKADSMNLNMHLLMVKYSIDFGTLENKKMVADLLVRHFPQKAEAVMNAAILYSAGDDKEMTERLFQQALSLDSANMKIVMNYATFKSKNNDLVQCLSLLEHALTLEPDNFLINYNKCVALIQLGRVEEASHIYLKLQKLAKEESEKELLRKLSQEQGF